MSDGEQDERRIVVEMFELAVIDLSAVNSPKANITIRKESGLLDSGLPGPVQILAVED